jgi:hypothetical protein
VGGELAVEHPASHDMNEEDIFNHTKDACICLIRPTRLGDTYRKEILSVVAFSTSVPDELVSAMITGASWRERLLGLCMAMAKQPENFTQPMLQSLRSPRGISIVPTCAALTLLAHLKTYAMQASFAQMFERQAFDGEVGWAADKALNFAGLRNENVPGCGPNYGQCFEDHLQLYNWINAG